MRPTKTFNSLWITGAIFTVTSSILAHDSVVVVPLFGDDGPTSKTVFVTSNVYSGNLGGVAGADSICQAEADATKSIVSGTYKAWVAGAFPEDFTSGRTFTKSTVPYVTVDGREIAMNFDDLIDGAISTPINAFPDGAISSGQARVWTSIGATGIFFSPQDCSGWTSDDFMQDAWVGNLADQNDGWTDDLDVNGCNNLYNLYCFEQ